MSWTAVPDLDLSHYVIRYSSETTGATYSKAVDLFSKISRPAVSVVAPAMTGTYFIKAVDKLGYESTTATEVVALIDSVKDLNVIDTLTEDPSFAGTKVSCHIDTSNFLILSTGLFDDVLGLFDDGIGNFDSGNGSVANSGTYYFANSIDLGAVYTSRVTANLKIDRIEYANIFDLIKGNFDDRTGFFDGNEGQYSDTNVELYVSVTNDDPASPSAVWTDYRQFFVGDYTARGLKFKCVLTTKTGTSSPSIENLSVTIDMPDRVISDNAIVSGAGAKVVTFNKAFKATPALGISAENLQQGDFYEISSKSASGFTITFKNSSGTAVSRTFDYVAKGYGELTV